MSDSPRSLSRSSSAQQRAPAREIWQLGWPQLDCDAALMHLSFATTAEPESLRGTLKDPPRPRRGFSMPANRTVRRTEAIDLIKRAYWQDLPPR